MEERTTRRHRLAHVAILGACALVFSSLLLIPSAIQPTEAAPTFTDARVKMYEEELKRLQTEKNALTSKIYTARQNQADALELKGYLDQQLNLTMDEIEALEELIAETDDKIGKKNLEIIDKKADVDEQRENFLKRLRITYEEGETGYLEMLLGADSLYDFLTRVERVGYMMDYNVKLMEKYQNATVELEAEEDYLEAMQIKNEEAKVKLEETEAELNQQLTDNQAYLNTLTTSIAVDSAAQQKLTAEEDKVNKEMEAYIRELQAKANAAYVGGEFRWPVDVSWKRISSYFGWRTLWGVRDYHRGIDIPASAWSNIYASNGGTVIKAEYHWSYGNYVIIDHGGGKSTLYAHAYQLNVKVGDKVKQGQIIAKVGTTGNSSGNHLHFEVRINGECKNPLDGYVTQPK